MKDEKIHWIVLSGLLHDVGKLLERAEIFPQARNDPHYLSFCRDSNGHPTHLHAAHTAAFCDWLEARFDCLRTHTDKSWKIWCAAHHRDDETGFEASVIRIADRLSSSERETGEYYKRDIHKKTLLEPVLERVCLQENTDNTATHHRIALCAQSLDPDGIFPKGASELQLVRSENPEAGFDDPSRWNHMLAGQPLTEPYKTLADGLMNEIEALAKKHPDIDLADLTATLTTFLEMYTVNVPSATNLRHPDISLFDHLRTTASIAQGLYLYQSDRNHPKQDIENKADPKWALVCGDFSGIQKFIYNLTNKGAAKGLRGRSFYVQLFCRIACDFILRKAGLSRAAILYNSGGKFYLLAPNTAREDILKARSLINDWLLSEFYGSVFLGIGMSPVTGVMFEQGKMSTAWKEVAEALERDRLTRFRENMGPQFFEPDTGFNPVTSCAVCGSRILKPDAPKCDSCERLEKIGAWIKDMDAVLVVWGNSVESDRIERAANIRSFIRIEKLGVSVFLVSREKLAELATIRGIDGECLMMSGAIQNARLTSVAMPACSLSMLHLGKWDSERNIRQNGDEWDFEDYAENAEGIKRLGILRMDVDNLGSVFIDGLRWPERDRNGWGDIILENGQSKLKTMASISRMATLSRQLHLFFAGYVPALLDQDRFNRAQIVYAGGDDLFVLGSWDQLPSLAETIREDFRRFCCHNPDMSISGGITLHGGRFPIYKGAQMAGEAEHAAKAVRRRWSSEEKTDIRKDGFCFLGTPIVWEDMGAVRSLHHLLEKEVKEDHGWLGYLMQMTAANQIWVEKVIKTKGLSWADAWQELAYQSWRWRTAYQLKRRFGKDDRTIETWANLLFNDRYDNHDPEKETTLPVYNWLSLPLRWTDYLHRSKGGK
ncbi:type III-A CRISPR-associated protein Cas10/Csm1 [Desulfatirhabdium butyrativorans]|uniref:type III-A CRISPR-associated protein Cas10/Csm1 n=1 Tax=Desulfatirhabdium butyrativorans TaxID=340467 RepID=UPI00041646EE|nr:type III-A CRISPR-associated protein Cas10/Csm1 [Desulfatirhabdium butyrativorans]